MIVRSLAVPHVSVGSMPKIVILFNGPKRAGKDTASAALADAAGTAVRLLKFTDPVKRLAHETRGIERPTWWFEPVKDAPLAEFGGLTPRQAYIATGDRLREERGEDAVAKLFVEAMAACGAEIVVGSDLGREAEAALAAEAVGAENVFILRIHRDGHDFREDCRGWIDVPGIRSEDVWNRGDASFVEEVVRRCAAFAESRGVAFERTVVAAVSV